MSGSIIALIATCALTMFQSAMADGRYRKLSEYEADQYVPALSSSRMLPREH